MIHLISLGAGVQSSAMALMAAQGELSPAPEAAIFADTQAEPDSVYRWLDWLEKQLPFPVERVTAGSLRDMATSIKTTADGRKYQRTAIPFHCDNGGMIPHRSCTRDFKLRPLMKAARRIAGIKRGQKELGVIQWIGISLDEMQRMKPSREPWAENRYPLIERRITRQQCLEWMEAKGYPQPPRSACVFCPFHSNKEWRRLQLHEPEAFQAAVEFEKEVQSGPAENFETMKYLHKSCKPLDTIDFRTDVERGQRTLWDDECEGMCGI